MSQCLDNSLPPLHAICLQEAWPQYLCEFIMSRLTACYEEHVFCTNGGQMSGLLRGLMMTEIVKSFTSADSGIALPSNHGSSMKRRISKVLGNTGKVIGKYGDKADQRKAHMC